MPHYYVSLFGKLEPCSQHNSVPVHIFYHCPVKSSSVCTRDIHSWSPVQYTVDRAVMISQVDGHVTFIIIFFDLCHVMYCAS